MVAGYNELGEVAATSHKKVFYALGQSDLTEPVKLKEAKKVKRKLVLGIVASLLLVVVFTGAYIVQASEAMAVEEANKVIVQRSVWECWNTGNIDVIGEFYAADLVNHDPKYPDIRNGEEFKQWVIGLFTAYDFHVTIMDLIAEGDMVVKRYTNRITVKATGEQIPAGGTTIYRLSGGKIVEAWWAR